MKNLDKALNILGCKVINREENIKGVATHICFDIRGHLNVFVNVNFKNYDEKREGSWHGYTYLEILSEPADKEKPSFHLYESALS